MARYKLGISNRKEGRIIDLDNIVKLQKLQSLDEFTSAFKDESQFKIYLFNQELITNEELDKKLNIMYKYDGKVKKIPVIYEDIKKYLDIGYLRYELKALCSNIEFLGKLANFYSNGSTRFNKQGQNVSDIRLYLSDVRSNGGYTFYSNLLETAINDLFEKAIFKERNYSTGEVIDDYRGLRDLALFIYKFKMNLVKKEEKETKEFNNHQVSNEEWIQTSFDDIVAQQKNEPIKLSTKEEISNNKWILSSEGDPDFPPNSLEEENYFRYLEELQNEGNFDIESHPHYRR